MNARSPRVGALIQRLRSQPMRPDEVTRRRMEQRLLEELRSEVSPCQESELSLRTGDERASAIVPARRRSLALSLRVEWVVIAAVAAVVGVGVGIGWSLSGDRVGEKPRLAVSRSAEGGASGQLEWVSDVRSNRPVTQSIRAGMRLAPADGERAVAVMGPAVLRAAPGALVTLDQPASPRRVVSVQRGALDIVFHPKRSQSQTLIILTPSARVKVVGTVLRVAVSAAGGTAVEVREGRVQVFSRTLGTASFVEAGDGVFRVAALRAPREPVEDGSETPAATIAPDETTPAFSPPASSPMAGVDGPGAGLSSPSRENPPPDVTPPPGEVDESEAVSIGAWPSALFGEVDSRLVLADRQLEDGLVERGRHTLYQVVREPASQADRARAWLRLGQSFEASHDGPNAAEAYRRAIRVNPGSPAAVEAKNELCVLVDDWRCSQW